MERQTKRRQADATDRRSRRPGLNCSRGICRLTIRSYLPTLPTLLTLLVGLLLASSGIAQTFTYSYSNLFDGGLAYQPGLSDYDALIAVEEAFNLWAGVTPLNFVEVPDSGPLPTADDRPYDATHAADIRIGHHDLAGNTLAHAFGTGPSGIAQDVHLDSSNRAWSEILMFSTVAHELGHALDLPHIEGVVSLMNAQLGGANLLTSPGESTLFKPEIEAIQTRWGAGRGRVETQRTWGGSTSDVQLWTDHTGWLEGWQPSRFSQVVLGRSGNLVVDSDVGQVRQLSLAGARNQLELNEGARLRVQQDLALGQRNGGDRLLSVGDMARWQVPVDNRDEAAWFLRDFDDSAWPAGPNGLGYERSTGYETLIETDLEDPLYNRNGSVYTRFEFDVAAPSELDFLHLNLMYDDGFVAYLNGAEVARGNSPVQPAWNATATVARADDDARQFETFDLSDQLNQLHAGRNVLAIQAMNSRTGSSDLLLRPQVLGGQIDNTLTVIAGELEILGSLRLAEDPTSESVLQIESGSVHVGQNIGRGDGHARIEMRGGTLQVDGGFGPQHLVAVGDSARIQTPLSDAEDAVWQRADFDDSRWREGFAGFGYERSTGFESLIATDLEAELYNTNASFYSRFHFQVDSLDDVDQLLLDVKYDDGFVAFLNGTEVATVNAPDQLAWDSFATRASDEALATTFETFDLSQFADLLVEGDNVLAIQGLNSSSSSSDMLLVPQLSARKLAGTLSVDQLNWYGGQLLGVADIEGRFEHHEGVFSPGRRPTETGRTAVVGPYHQHSAATLRLDLDVDRRSGDSRLIHDQLAVDGPAMLEGTIDIHWADESDPDVVRLLKPQAAGDEIVFSLLEATQISGSLAGVALNGGDWNEHQGNGLFWFVDLLRDHVALRALQARPGDANGDGLFDSSDLVQVFRRGQYEDAIVDNSDWTTGDWNGDGEFTSRDMLVAFQEGGFESSSRSARGVPEPDPAAILFGVWGLRRRRSTAFPTAPQRRS